MPNNTNATPPVDQKFGFELRADNNIYDIAGKIILTGQTPAEAKRIFNNYIKLVAQKMRECCQSNACEAGAGSDEDMADKNQEDLACICPHCAGPLTKHASENGYNKLKCNACGFDISCGDVNLDHTLTPDSNGHKVNGNTKKRTL